MSHLRFGEFNLDLQTGDLRKGDALVRLQPQPLKVLLLLARHAGQVVSREDIRRQVWADDTFVDFEQGLNYCIRRIRAALGDDAQAARFIETVPKRGYRFVVGGGGAPAPAVPRVMLVVLPFQNLTGDPEQEFLSDGVTEEVTAQLARLNPDRLGVIARTSALQYKHAGRSIDAIGRELGVSHALEGSVRRGGGRVRVTAQLVRVADQTQLWSESFERSDADILALQADVARAVARETGVQLTPRAELRLERPRAVHSAAYDEYLKGRYFWKRRSRDALERSARHFGNALEIDPEYAPAHAGLADVYLTQLDYNYLRPRDAFARADRALLDALRLDNAVAEPHTSLGHLRFHQFEWAASARAFETAIALNPGYDSAHYYYANLHAAFGRFDEALAEANRALALDPVSPNTRQNRLFVLCLARRYDQAIAEVIATLEMDPAYTALYYYLGQVLALEGDYEGAIDAYRNVSPKSHSRGATVLAAIAYTEAKAGNRERALGMLAELENLPAGAYVSLYDMALLHFALGDADRGFALLETAYDEYSSFLPFLNIDARLDDARSDPRFDALVRKMKLER